MQLNSCFWLRLQLGLTFSADVVDAVNTDGEEKKNVDVYKYALSQTTLQRVDCRGN